MLFIEGVDGGSRGYWIAGLGNDWVKGWERWQLRY